MEQTGLIHFMELLNEQFLATRGYGSGAFLSMSAVTMLYHQLTTQKCSEKEKKLFIKRIVNQS